MNITIQTIDHAKHLYPTAGDWRFDQWGDLNIKVSNMGDWKFEFLVAFHEQIETVLCKVHGIKEEDVTAFDIAFEKERAEGKHDEYADPGDDSRAPYYIQHRYATTVEREMATHLGVDWGAYGEAISKLP